MEKINRIPPGGATRLRLTESERRAHLLAWKHSGRSAPEYAAEHGLRARNLYAWSKKMRTGSRERAEGSPFIPVRIAPGGFAGRGLQVTLKSRDLECVIEGAEVPEAIAVLAGALKREVFDV